MYICTDCGSLFNTPDFSKRKAICPDCGGKNIREANYCKLCHEYFVGGEFDHYCPDCKQTAEDQLRSAVTKWVDADMIELLKSEYSDLEYLLGDES